VPDRISDSRGAAPIDKCATASCHLHPPWKIIEERKARVREVRRIHNNGTTRGFERRSLRGLVAHRSSDHCGAPDARGLHRRCSRGADIDGGRGETVREIRRCFQQTLARQRPLVHVE
jgi:hypothetical protein